MSSCGYFSIRRTFTAYRQSKRNFIKGWNQEFADEIALVTKILCKQKWDIGPSTKLLFYFNYLFTKLQLFSTLAYLQAIM
jgi:hypothetical protein